MRWERSRSGLLSTASMVSNKTTFIATTRPAVRHAQTVDQTQDQREEVVRHLLLGDARSTAAG